MPPTHGTSTVQWGITNANSTKHDADLDDYRAEFDGYIARSEQVQTPNKISAGVRLFTIAICTWVLAETPAEFDPLAGVASLAALLLSKAIWLSLGAALLHRVRGAQSIFSVLCCISICAMTPALPYEYRHLSYAFVLSLVDCGLKVGFLACVLFSH